jgi:hypothetical protein
VYELAGTVPTSHAEAAEVFEKILKRQVRVEREEIGDWRQHAVRSGMSGYAVDNLVRMFEYYDRWGLVGNPNVLKWILEREPRLLEDFIVFSITDRN